MFPLNYKYDLFLTFFAGWNQPMFACSYKLNFKSDWDKCYLQKQLVMFRKACSRLCRKTVDDIAVYVDVCGVHSDDFSKFHDRWGDSKYITSVLSPNVTHIRISSASTDKPLSQILTSIEIYFRRIPLKLEGPLYGEVVHMKINLGQAQKQTVEAAFKHCFLRYAVAFDTEKKKNLTNVKQKKRCNYNCCKNDSDPTKRDNSQDNPTPVNPNSVHDDCNILQHAIPSNKRPGGDDVPVDFQLIRSIVLEK